jgi:probable selenium-dependent hydroxylase accessory protein YqeC
MSALALLDALRPGALVALVGGGGKTATCERLVAEASARGRRAVFTTTTGTYARAPFPIRLFASAAEAARALAPGDLPALVARAGMRPDKLGGFEAADVPALLEVADLVVVECDGARRLPLKAFGPGEPPLPPGATDYVIVVGLEAIGRRIEEGSVFRPERLAAVLGVSAGTEITEDLVSRAVTGPGGYLSAAPAEARVAVLLWGAATEGRRAAGRRIAGRLLFEERRIETALVGDLVSPGAGIEIQERPRTARPASAGGTPSRGHGTPSTRKE